MGDGYNSDLTRTNEHRKSRHSVGAGILRQSLANIERSDPEFARELKKTQRDVFSKTVNFKKKQIFGSGVFMPGMSEGILDEPSKEEEDMKVIFSEEQDDFINIEKPLWN